MMKIVSEVFPLAGNSWLTALFGVILPFKDIIQIQKSGRLKSCLRTVSEGAQSLVELIQTMNEK